MALTNENVRDRQFWNKALEIAQESGKVRESLRAIVVTHILHDRPHFLNAIDEMAKIAAVIPKPKSVNNKALHQLEPHYPVWRLRREDIKPTREFTEALRQRVEDHPFVVLDIGGYFADALEHLSEQFPGQLLGVVEDTENGQQKYEKLRTTQRPVPVISAARSPLKQPEDFLVGEAVVFSTEAILREMNEIMVGKVALVIGYGKIGQSISRRLAGRGMQVKVFDWDPMKRTLAFAHGHLIPSRHAAITQSDIIFCATGNSALSSADFGELRAGAFVVSVTSSDDELSLIPGYERMQQPTQVTRHVKRFDLDDTYYHLVNEGNAVNFIHGGVVGSFIYLVQAELLAGISHLERLRHEDYKPVVISLPDDPRNRIANAWISVFGRDS